MSSATDLDLTVLEALDFEPECEASACKRAAVWLAQCRRCAEARRLCNLCLRHLLSGFVMRHDPCGAIGAFDEVAHIVPIKGGGA